MHYCFRNKSLKKKFGIINLCFSDLRFIHPGNTYRQKKKYYLKKFNWTGFRILMSAVIVKVIFNIIYKNKVTHYNANMKFT